MLPILTLLEALRASLAPTAARLLRAYGAYQIRRALHRLQRSDIGFLLVLTQLAALHAQHLGTR